MRPNYWNRCKTLSAHVIHAPPPLLARGTICYRLLKVITYQIWYTYVSSLYLCQQCHLQSQEVRYRQPSSFDPLSLSLAHYWFSLFYSLLFSSSPNEGHEDGGYDNEFVMNNNNKKNGLNCHGKYCQCSFSVKLVSLE